MSNMPQRPFGKTGVSVPAIALGALEIGRNWAPDVNPDGRDAHLGPDDAVTMLKSAAAIGVTFFDTAAAYWRSEDYIGRAVQAGLGPVFIATKFGESWSPDGGSVYDYSPQGARASLERSLQRMAIPTVDLFQIHSAKPEHLQNDELLSTLQKLKSDGKVRYLGLSADPQTCIQAIKLGVFDAVQTYYSILASEAADEMLACAAQAGVAVMLMRTLAGGKLTSKFTELPDGPIKAAVQRLLEVTEPANDPSALATLAIRWALSRPEVSTVLLGTRRVEALEIGRQAAIAGPLPQSTLDAISQVIKDTGARAW